MAQASIRPPSIGSQDGSLCPIHRGLIAMNGPRSLAVHSDCFENTNGRGSWSTQASAEGRDRFAGELLELLHQHKDRGVEVAVVRFLRVGGSDRLCQGPEHVVALTVVDHQPEEGPRLDCAIDLIHVVVPGWAAGRGELQFQHQVGICRVGCQLKLSGGLERSVELGVAAIRIAGEG